MLKSQSIINWFYSNFGFYISGPILTKYEIPHQISTNPITSNLKISTTSNAFYIFGFYNSWPILTKYMIPHQISTNPTTSHFKISTNSNAYISVNSQPILVKFWILNLMTNPSIWYRTKSQPLLILLYQSIFISFVSNFGFYNPNKVLDMEVEVGTKLEVGTKWVVGTNLEVETKLEFWTKLEVGS